MRLYCEHPIVLGADRFGQTIHAPDYEARVAAALGLAECCEVERPEAWSRTDQSYPPGDLSGTHLHAAAQRT